MPDAERLIDVQTGGQSSTQTPVAPPQSDAVARADDAVAALLGELSAQVGAPGDRAALARVLGSETLRELAPEAPGIGEVEALAATLRRLQDKHADRVFKFGIVGFQSSGKSYLISALFGQKDFLPSLDEATTSVVTRIRYPIAGEPTDRIRVLFHAEAGKQEFVQFLHHLNSTERLANPIRFDDIPGELAIEAGFSQKDFFLKCDNPGRDLPKYRLIHEVHLRQASSFLTDYTEIIDLPGLGGPYALLDETTMQYLDEVDAVLVISPVNHNWVQKDTDVFKAFASRPHVLKKVFFVLSKLDAPGSPVEQSIRTFHNLLEQFASAEIRADRVFYISAWMALFDKLENPTQEAHLSAVAASFARDDPNTFHHVEDAALRAKLALCFTPRDGGVATVRDALFGFFSTHKRLLQLNEILVELHAALKSALSAYQQTVTTIARQVGDPGRSRDRELFWIKRRQEQLLDEALTTIAGRVEPRDLPAVGYTAEADQLVAETLGHPDIAPEDALGRIAAVQTLGPRLARKLAAHVAAQVAPALASRTKAALAAGALGEYWAAFPPELRERLQDALAQWEHYVYACARMLLGGHLLRACVPPDGAVRELDPFRPCYQSYVAEAAGAALMRASRELSGTVVAAWDALARAVGVLFDEIVPAFYTAHPDAPRPLVESPEVVLTQLEQFTEKLGTHADRALSLDRQVHAWLDAL